MWWLAAGLACYLVGAVFRRNISFAFAALGSAFQAAASWTVLAGGPTVTWTLPVGTPLFPWTLRLDPLSAWFNLALALLAFAVSVYSIGYVRKSGLMGFFYNLLLLSLTLVFTAANAFFFLTAWELMTILAYCLITFEHEKPEARRAAMVFFIMSHAGSGLLLAGFLILAAFTGTIDFARLHLVATQLPLGTQGIVFLL